MASDPTGIDPMRLEASVNRLYQHRFPRAILERRREVWKIFCKHWLARYIKPSDSVLEVAAGYCEFINAIAAQRKTVIDLNPETREHAAPDVAVHLAPAERLSETFPNQSFDAIFMSNFLEHLRDRDQVLGVLRGCASVLQPGGRILILGPNFRYTYAEYFDFFDHHTELTELSVAEALDLAGFEVEVCLAKTLPFSFRSRLPSWPWLVRLYLALPILWPLFGKQFFLVGRKR